MRLRDQFKHGVVTPAFQQTTFEPVKASSTTPFHPLPSAATPWCPNPGLDVILALQGSTHACRRGIEVDADHGVTTLHDDEISLTDFSVEKQQSTTVLKLASAPVASTVTTTKKQVGAFKKKKTKVIGVSPVMGAAASPTSVDELIAATDNFISEVVGEETFEQDLNECLAISAQLIRLRTITGGFRNTNVAANLPPTHAKKLISEFAVFQTTNTSDWADKFSTILSMYIGRRYFIRHVTAALRDDQRVFRDFMYKNVIRLLKNLITDHRFSYIQRASIIFLMDTQDVSDKLFQEFVAHPDWASFRLQKISCYSLSKVKSSMTVLEDNLRQKFKNNLQHRYIVIFTSAKNTSDLFNNLGSLRKVRLSNLCVLSIM